MPGRWGFTGFMAAPFEVAMGQYDLIPPKGSSRENEAQESRGKAFGFLLLRADFFLLPTKGKGISRDGAPWGVL